MDGEREDERELRLPLLLLRLLLLLGERRRRYRGGGDGERDTELLLLLLLLTDTDDIEGDRRLLSFLGGREGDLYARRFRLLARSLLSPMLLSLLLSLSLSLLDDSVLDPESDAELSDPDEEVETSLSLFSLLLLLLLSLLVDGRRLSKHLIRQSIFLPTITGILCIPFLLLFFLLGKDSVSKSFAN